MVIDNNQECNLRLENITYHDLATLSKVAS
nr:MAG TPA: hypothetical protein [Caudoviricetes sp.]